MEDRTRACDIDLWQVGRDQIVGFFHEIFQDAGGFGRLNGGYPLQAVHEIHRCER